MTSALLYSSDASLGVAVAVGALVYVVLVVSIAPMIKVWELSPSARHALAHLQDRYSKGPRVPIDGAHSQGSGSIAGVPLYLAASFRKGGVAISIHYSPTIRPRNIAIDWEDIASMLVEGGELILVLRDMPRTEIRIPYMPSREFTSYVASRVQGVAVTKATD